MLAVNAVVGCFKACFGVDLIALRVFVVNARFVVFVTRDLLLDLFNAFDWVFIALLDYGAVVSEGGRKGER